MNEQLIFDPSTIKDIEDVVARIKTLINQKSEPVVIALDGAYSSRPELEDIIDLKVLVEVPNDNHRKTRLVNREGDAYMSDWHKRWDHAEDYYFS